MVILLLLLQLLTAAVLVVVRLPLVLMELQTLIPRAVLELQTR
jgi:hypothetical protein